MKTGLSAFLTGAGGRWRPDISCPRKAIQNKGEIVAVPNYIPGGDAANPAWDFQLVVPDYQVGAEYGLRLRLVRKPWAGRADVLAEVREFLAGL